jgi:hypothetical protein
VTAASATAAIKAAKAARVEDFAFLRDHGVPLEDAAERLEISLQTAERYEKERIAAGGPPWPQNEPWWPWSAQGGTGQVTGGAGSPEGSRGDTAACSDDNTRSDEQ